MSSPRTQSRDQITQEAIASHQQLRELRQSMRQANRETLEFIKQHRQESQIYVGTATASDYTTTTTSPTTTPQSNRTRNLTPPSRPASASSASTERWRSNDPLQYAFRAQSTNNDHKSIVDVNRSVLLPSVAMQPSLPVYVIKRGLERIPDTEAFSHEEEESTLFAPFPESRNVQPQAVEISPVDDRVQPTEQLPMKSTKESAVKARMRTTRSSRTQTEQEQRGRPLPPIQQRWALGSSGGTNVGQPVDVKQHPLQDGDANDRHQSVANPQKEMAAAGDAFIGVEGTTGSTQNGDGIPAALKQKKPPAHRTAVTATKAARTKGSQPNRIVDRNVSRQQRSCQPTQRQQVATSAAGTKSRQRTGTGQQQLPCSERPMDRPSVNSRPRDASATASGLSMDAATGSNGQPSSSLTAPSIDIPPPEGNVKSSKMVPRSSEPSLVDVTSLTGATYGEASSVSIAQVRPAVGTVLSQQPTTQADQSRDHYVHAQVRHGYTFPVDMTRHIATEEPINATFRPNFSRNDTFVTGGETRAHGRHRHLTSSQLQGNRSEHGEPALHKITIRLEILHANEPGEADDQEVIVPDMRQLVNERRWTAANHHLFERAEPHVFHVTVDRTSSSLVHDLLQHYQSVPSVFYRAPLKISFRGEPGVDNGALTREYFNIVFNSIVFDNACQERKAFQGEPGHLLPAIDHVLTDRSVFWFIGLLCAQAVNSGCYGLPGLCPALRLFLGLFGARTGRISDIVHAIQIEDVADLELRNLLTKLKDDVQLQDAEVIVVQHWLDDSKFTLVLNATTRHQAYLHLLRYYVFDSRMTQLQAIAEGLDELDYRDHSAALVNELYPDEDYLRTTLPMFLSAVNISDVIHASSAARITSDFFVSYCLELAAGNLSLATLLCFFTGAPYLPPSSHQSVTLHISFAETGDTTSLPRARTCVNELVLPVSHTTYESFSTAMTRALTDGLVGFGLA